jgi:anti-sigma B factor antagonist
MPEFDQLTSDESPAGFAVVVERDVRGVRVQVAGELDISSAPKLDRVLEGLAGGGDLLLDLDGVGFMDSSGLAALIRAKQTAERYGQHLAIRYGTSRVRRVFELTGMLDQFPESEEDGDHAA